MNDEIQLELETIAAVFEDNLSYSVDESVVKGQLSINVEIPATYRLEIPEKLASSISFGKPICIEDGHAFYEVDHLPPILLAFQIPEGYPGEAHPSLHLTCSWLDVLKQTRLIQHLDAMQEEDDEQVIYQWAVFLQSDVLDLLEISEKLPVHVISQNMLQSHGVKKKVDTRVKQDAPGLRMLVETLLNYDETFKIKVFEETFHSCGVCFEHHEGQDCLKFSSCGHVFCKECLTGYFTSQIKEGEVTRLLCPDPSCGNPALPTEVKILVSQELFERYDRLLLAAALSGMNDVVHCPRKSCQCPVLIDIDEEDMASCPNCGFNFCVMCNRAWHGQNNCAIGDLKALAEEYQAAEGEAKKLLERRYGIKRLRHAVEEMLSQEFVKSLSKPCPTCKTDISKTDGCNKMMCTRCGVPFCWLCLHALDKMNPYAHFNSGSACVGQLFEGIEQDQDEWDLWEDEEDLFFDGFD